ncbi:E3 ubiquitin-protein ligase rnf14 [Nowakowskiella sp. JEL0078]|nr:E3 ubiquitin-protein ligase rnf14 [Nowakowskiella sp. JEL0078]
MNSGDSSENFDLQKAEIDAMKAIFTSNEFTCVLDSNSSYEAQGTFRGIINCELKLPDKTFIRIPFAKSTDTQDSRTQNLQIEFLPPVRIRFSLPNLYPSEEPPAFVVDCFWLPNDSRTKVKERLQQLWENEHSEILYTFGVFIQQDCFDFLNLGLASDEGIVIDLMHLWNVQDFAQIELIIVLGNQLLQYDSEKNESIFNDSQIVCGICLERKKGQNCLRITSCHHVFCKDCLKECFTLYIKEGSVELVTCLDPECKRRSSLENKNSTLKILPPAPLHSQHFESVVGKDLYLRYLKFVEAKTYEGRQDVVYCPRTTCETPVVRVNIDDKLCICSRCSFAFCALCLRCWHGYHTFCAHKNSYELALKYIESTPEEQKLLEQRYGHKIVLSYVKEFQAEKETMEYLRYNTVPCPTCETKVEKSMGSFLEKKDPYKHFSNKKAPCYGRLFENPGDEQDLLALLL